MIDFPPWIEALPEVATTFVGATGLLMGGPDGQVVYWTFVDGGDVPTHAHGPQLGFVVAGQVDLTVDGELTAYAAGSSFEIGDQVPHGAYVHPGTRVIEVFQERDRHRAR